MDGSTRRAALSDRTNFGSTSSSTGGPTKDRRALLAEWKNKAKNRSSASDGASSRTSLLGGGVRRTGLSGIGGGVSRVVGGGASNKRKSIAASSNTAAEANAKWAQPRSRMSTTSSRRDFAKTAPSSTSFQIKSDADSEVDYQTRSKKIRFDDKTDASGDADAADSARQPQQGKTGCLKKGRCVARAIMSTLLLLVCCPPLLLLCLTNSRINTLTLLNISSHRHFKVRYR